MTNPKKIVPTREKAIAYREDWLNQLLGQLRRGTYWSWEFSDNTKEEALHEQEQLIARVQREIAALHQLPEGSIGEAVHTAIKSAEHAPRKRSARLELSTRGILT
jgi:hypothetical protein